MREIHVYPGGVTASIDIGRQGETLASRVIFHLEGWADGDGYVQLLYIRPGESVPYPCALVQQDGTAVWPVIAPDTEQAGSGWCELRFVAGGILQKTRRFAVRVEPCINGSAPPEPTGLAGSWLEQLLERETVGAENAGKAAAEKAYADAEAVLDGYLADAEAAKTAAQTAQGVAEAAKTQAVSSMAHAEAAASAAADDVSTLLAGYVLDAQTAKTAAEAAQEAAEGAAATTAADVSTLLAGYVSDAQASRNAAEAAQGSAEAAQGAAETAQSAAELARTGAETAQGLAETARTGAETARGLAEAAQAAAAQAAAQALAAAAVVGITFTEESWVAPAEEGGYYQCFILPAAHGKTNGDFLFHVYHLVEGRLVSNTWGVAGTDVWYDAVSGDIVLRSRTPYAGKIALF